MELNENELISIAHQFMTDPLYSLDKVALTPEQLRMVYFWIDIWSVQNAEYSDRI